LLTFPQVAFSKEKVAFLTLYMIAHDDVEDDFDDDLDGDDSMGQAEKEKTAEEGGFYVFIISSNTRRAACIFRTCGKSDCTSEANGL